MFCRLYIDTYLVVLVACISDPLSTESMILSPGNLRPKIPFLASMGVAYSFHGVPIDPWDAQHTNLGLGRLACWRMHKSCAAPHLHSRLLHPACKMPATFAQLPRELRDMIWAMATPIQWL